MQQTDIKEYKSRYDWVGKVIYKELYKRLKLGHVEKWHMLTPESVLENLNHKILSDVGIQTNHQSPSQKTRPSFN